MRALTAVWVMCRLAAALMKLPVRTTSKRAGNGDVHRRAFRWQINAI
jgi:hypothetical protein